MKLIQGLKKIKELQEKAEDLKSKISKHHVDYDFETPVYGDKQRATVDGWLQSYHDLLDEILKLRIAIQRTNLATSVDIELGGKVVTKTIAEWIHRRRDLATEERKVWEVLNDKGLSDRKMKTTGDEVIDAKVRRYYDPETRDKKVDVFRSEPNVIDRTLEVVNATTDLVEA